MVNIGLCSFFFFSRTVQMCASAARCDSNARRMEGWMKGLGFFMTAESHNSPTLKEGLRGWPSGEGAGLGRGRPGLQNTSSGLTQPLRDSILHL